MAKGSTGVETNVIVRMKKPAPIPCDCERCKHSKKGAGTIYCSYYDIFSPRRKNCSRYWCVKPIPQSRKAETAKKQRKNGATQRSK